MKTESLHPEGYICTSLSCGCGKGKGQPLHRFMGGLGHGTHIAEAPTKKKAPSQAGPAVDFPEQT